MGDVYRVREVTGADLEALARIRAPLALHRDRLRDTADDYMVYVVIEQDSDLLGFGLLVFERPPHWSDFGDRSRLPSVVDLWVRPECRGRGAGTCLLGWLEETARAKGYSRLFLGVDPIENPRAHRLYLRLGYRALRARPVLSSWRVTDSDGNTHEGTEWSLDMVKDL